MPTSYSTNLKLSLMATGENDGTWGTITNTNLGTLLEQAIVARATVAMSDATTTITIADGVTSEARCYVLNLTGALTAARNLVVPTINKPYVVKNSTSGGFAVTVKTTAGTGISVPNGKTMPLFVDGTNVVDLFDQLSALTTTGTVAVGGNLAVAGTSLLVGATTMSGNLTVVGTSLLDDINANSLDVSTITGVSLSLDTLFSMVGGGDSISITPGDIGMTGQLSITVGPSSTILVHNAITCPGTITAAAYVTSSDYRLKEDVRPLVNSLERIKKLKPLSYVIDGYAKEGFLAHELAEAVPNAVYGYKDDPDEPQKVDYTQTIAVLTSALQEAVAKIERLEARVG